METLVCPHCKSLVRTAQQFCLACGWKVVVSQLVEFKDSDLDSISTNEEATPSVEVVSDSSKYNRKCDHKKSIEGSILCTVCGDIIEPTLLKSSVTDSKEYSVLLDFPWGSYTLKQGDVLDIGREVGPFKDNLQEFVTLSRRHASLRLNASGKLLIRNYSSTNGTYINGKSVTGTGEVEVSINSEVSFSRALKMQVRECG